jgi:malonate-semialdehyde dehydrogenase (acetylating)/methylmalonate-semialdehyde dehydrogenase
MLTIENAVAGKRYTSSSSRTSPVYNPATGEQSAILPLSTLDEINAAVASAKKAFPAWAATTPMKRARVMFKFKELLDRFAGDIAREISKEHGKVHDDAMGEVARGIDCVDFACGIPQLLKGEFSRNVGP